MICFIIRIWNIFHSSNLIYFLFNPFLEKNPYPSLWLNKRQVTPTMRPRPRSKRKLIYVGILSSPSHGHKNNAPGKFVSQQRIFAWGGGFYLLESLARCYSPNMFDNVLKWWDSLAMFTACISQWSHCCFDQHKQRTNTFCVVPSWFTSIEAFFLAFVRLCISV